MVSVLLTTANILTAVYYRMRYGKVGLHLGAHQVYYISQCEEKGSIQLTITMPETDDLTSAQERRELINDITGLLDDILNKLAPNARKHPIRFVPCPHCLALHITLSDISSGNSIFCAATNDTRLPRNYYDDLLDPAFLLGKLCILLNEGNLEVRVHKDLTYWCTCKHACTHRHSLTEIHTHKLLWHTLNKQLL